MPKCSINRYEFFLFTYFSCISIQLNRHSSTVFIILLPLPLNMIINKMYLLLNPKKIFGFYVIYIILYQTCVLNFIILLNLILRIIFFINILFIKTI